MYRIIRGKDEEEVSRKLANFIGDFLIKCIRDKGEAKVGLAGGNSPKGTYRILSRSFSLWDKVLIFPTDERFVPSEHPKSNYRMLRESLGDRAKLYRVKTELPLREACKEFNSALLEVRALDFILLGLGLDGHTASLFPNTPCLPCGENACTSKSPDGLSRISMSLSFINRAGLISFIVIGKKKGGILKRLLRGEDLPATKVNNGKEILIFTELNP